MEKFLFTDGSNGVKEVQSPLELKELIETSASMDTIRVWVFNSNEWLSYATFSKQFPQYIITRSPAIRKEPAFVPSTASVVKPKPRNRVLKKVMLYTGIGGAIFLVYNFTRIKWEKAEAITLSASRPDNVPVMDMDSLIADIEFTRGQKIDKNTRNNLRLRNTWPEKILLRASADRNVSNTGNKYSNIVISIDNTTGFKLDQALVLFTAWKDHKIGASDTVQFRDIVFSGMVKRVLSNQYRGDSISVSFKTIEAKLFNFCYSADKENSSGNYNDRWFCRSSE
jgi:hypothetical protein